MSMERMMIAFGKSSPLVVIDLAGPTLQEQFDIDPAVFVETIEDQASELGLQGVQVWEGDPVVTYDDQYGDFWDCDFSHGRWRRPTDAEWVALRAERSPFNSPVEDLQSLVE
jgi:hypothetical protein